jgi:hypothetical protein
MKRLMVSAFAAVALLAVATTMRDRTRFRPIVLSEQLVCHSFSNCRILPILKKLPAEEFEDQSLVYSTVAKH